MDRLRTFIDRASLLLAAFCIGEAALFLLEAWDRLPSSSEAVGHLEP